MPDPGPPVRGAPRTIASTRRRSRPAAVRLAAWLLCAWPALARAHYAGDSITVGNRQSPGVPSSTYFTDKLSLALEPIEIFALRLDLAYTYYLPAPPPPSARFGSSASSIFFLNMGIDFLPDPHWILSIDANGSPRAGFVQDSPVTFGGGGRPIDAEVRQTTSTAGVMLSAVYDTAGDSRAETAIDASVGYTSFSTDLQVVRIVDSNGAPQTREQIDAALAYCSAHPADKVSCSDQRRAVLQSAAGTFQQPASGAVGQWQLLAGLTETLYQDTDVGLSGAYYLYTVAHPAAYLASSGPLGPGGGRSGSGGGAILVSRDYGTGVALSPLWFTVRPELTQRFGGFSLGVSFQYGRYVDDADYAYSLTLGAKLMYRHRFQRFRVKVWLSGTGQRDVDAASVGTLSGSLSAGARFNF